jgi:hypothetical protein
MTTMDSQFAKFKFNGQLFLWKYRDNIRNYPGWNISLDPAGCDSFLSLLDLMEQSEYSSLVSFFVNEPSQEHLNIANRGARYKICKRIKLNHKKQPDDLWHMNESTSALTITFGLPKLQELKESIEKVQSGDGDFAITEKKESEENILYFWCHSKGKCAK